MAMVVSQCISGRRRYLQKQNTLCSVEGGFKLWPRNDTKVQVWEEEVELVLRVCEIFRLVLLFSPSSFGRRLASRRMRRILGAAEMEAGRREGEEVKK